MKPKYFYVPWALLWIGSTFATVISGKIANASEKEISITGLSFRADVPLNADGTFSKDLEIKHNGLYTFIHGDNKWEVYLTTNGGLQLAFDQNNIVPTLIYTGVNAPESTYLYQKSKLYDLINKDGARTYALKEPEFVKAIDGLVLSDTELLKNSNNLSPFFRKTEAKRITYNAQSYYYNYKYLHSYYAKTNVSKAKLCQARQFDSDTVRISYDEFLYGQVFRGYQYGRFVKSFDPQFRKNPDHAKEILQAELQGVHNPVIEDFLLKNLRTQLRSYEDKNDYLMQAIIDLTKDEALKKEMQLFLENKGKFVEGAVAPDFELHDQNGNKVRLADFRGKNVYIDFWATWCGPCVGEIPELKKLEEKFKDRNVVFLSISLDSQKDLEKWKNYLVKKELGGTQLIVEDAWKSEVVRQYMVDSIPRFILIDTNGILVDTHAPRPSSGKAARAVNRLDSL